MCILHSPLQRSYHKNEIKFSTKSLISLRYFMDAHDTETNAWSYSGKSEICQFLYGAFSRLVLLLQFVRNECSAKVLIIKVLIINISGKKLKGSFFRTHCFSKKPVISESVFLYFMTIVHAI